MRVFWKVVIGLTIFSAIILLSFFYYAGSKIHNAIEGNPPGTFNNTIAIEIPLIMLNYYNNTLNKSIPDQCKENNTYYLQKNYSFIPCIETLNIENNIKQVCIEKQKLIEQIVTERRDYGKIKLGWVSLSDTKMFEIIKCIELINNSTKKS